MTDDFEAGGEIPKVIRKEIDERDQRFCRVCGVHCDSYSSGREIHHIVYGGSVRGVGGRRIHDPDEMVSLCKSCHQLVHTDKEKWTPVLLEVVRTPGVTALQLLRWKRSRKARETRKRDMRSKVRG